VKEFAEDEGAGSLPFRYLVKDITRVLTTILVASTICTIYGTALITTVIAQHYQDRGTPTPTPTPTLWLEAQRLVLTTHVSGLNFFVKIFPHHVIFFCLHLR